MRQWRCASSYSGSLHRPVSTKRCPRCAAVDRSRYRAIFFGACTKDKKKGCAYDPGALNKQGALQNQTLRYLPMPLNTTGFRLK